MEDEDWEILSKIKRSNYRLKILKYLNDLGEPRTPTEISSKTDISRSHVSRTLGDLKEYELVEVLNPDAHYDRRYRITERGTKIIEKIQEIEDE